MNVLGYLITLANLQNFSGNGGPLKDLSININRLRNLADNIKSHHEFPLGSFRENGYSRVGDVGMFLSKNLRDYIYEGRNDPLDEGLILTLYYEKQSHARTYVFNDDSLSNFIHKNNVHNASEFLDKLEHNDEEKLPVTHGDQKVLV